MRGRMRVTVSKSDWAWISMNLCALIFGTTTYNSNTEHLLRCGCSTLGVGASSVWMFDTSVWVSIRCGCQLLRCGCSTLLWTASSSNSYKQLLRAVLSVNSENNSKQLSSSCSFGVDSMDCNFGIDGVKHVRVSAKCRSKICVWVLSHSCNWVWSCSIWWWIYLAG